MMHQHFHIAEMDRRLSNMIRLGTIKDIDHKKARVRVSVGKLCTDFLPWVVGGAGHMRSWSPPSVGEQVVVLSPGGDLGQGVVLPSLYQNKYPAPHDKENVTTLTFPDGTTFTYDTEEKALSIKIGASSIHVTGEAITIKAPLVTINGKVM